MAIFEKYHCRRDDAAVMVVDVQGVLLGIQQNQEKTVKNISILLEAAKAYEMPALYTEQYPKAMGPTVEPLLSLLKECHAAYDSKTVFNGMTDKMIRALGETGRKQVILMGMETQACVFATCRALLEHGYDVIVPRDCVTSRFAENWENALDVLQEMGAVIMNMEMVLLDLIGDAKDPQFRSLQKLIM